MAKEFRFETVESAGRSVDDIHDDLRARIEPIVRRTRKVDVSLLDIKPGDAKRER